VVEINESIAKPQLLSHFLTRNYLAGVFKKQRQNLKRLVLQSDSSAVLTQFASAEIDFV